MNSHALIRNPIVKDISELLFADLDHLVDSICIEWIDFKMKTPTYSEIETMANHLMITYDIEEREGQLIKLLNKLFYEN
jgi:hypothetical protein